MALMAFRNREEGVECAAAMKKLPDSVGTFYSPCTSYLNETEAGTPRRQFDNPAPSNTTEIGSIREPSLL